MFKLGTTIIIVFSLNAFAAEESTSRMPTQESTSRGWANAGLGTTEMSIDQTIDGIGSVSQSIASILSQYLEAGYMTSGKWGGRVSYTRVPTATLDVYRADGATSHFRWSEVKAEVMKEIPTRIGMFRAQTDVGIHAGMVRRDSNLVVVDGDGTPSSREISVTAADLAGSMNIYSAKWHHVFNLGCEFPLQSSGYDFSGRYIPHFGIGSTRDFAGHFTMGLFGTVKYHNGRYHYTADGLDQSGGQNITAIAMNFRLGMHF